MASWPNDKLSLEDVKAKSKLRYWESEYFFIEFLPQKINDELFSWSLWMPTLLFLVGHLAVAEVDPRKEAEDPDVNEETL